MICPWDVADAGTVPGHKTELLLALHALLIGHAHDPEGRVRTLDSDEETLIRDAASKPPTGSTSKTGERPREQLLIDVLTDRATSRRADRRQRRPAAVAAAATRALRRGRQRSRTSPTGATTVPADTPLTLFDFTGLSERLTPALMLATVEYVERQVQRLRRARVDGELDHLGPWAGKCQLIIEEGWALTQSPAAGAWLNEYARRSRHYALWLMFVSQHFRDLSNEQGRALLANGALSFCLRNDRDDLEHAREPLGLSDTDIAADPGAPQTAGRLLDGVHGLARGRGAVRVALGDLEYWICSSDPEHDQPRRAAALRDSRRRPVGGARQALHARLARALPPGQRSRGMTDQRHALVGDARSPPAPQGCRGWSPAGAFMIVISPVVLFAGAGNPPCHGRRRRPAARRVPGPWIATAYGPPWDAINGERHHRHRPEPDRRPACVRDRRRPGSDRAPELRARHPQPVRHARARSTPATPAARSSATTSTSTTGWAAPPSTRGGSATSRSRPRPTPVPATCWARSRRRRRAKRPRRLRRRCAQPRSADRLRSLPASRRRSSRADSPPPRSEAPPTVKLAIAAGNQLISKPYIWGGGHGVPLSQLDAGVRLLGRHQLHPARRRRARTVRRGLDAARELRPTGPGCVDHRVRQLGPRVHRRRRDRDEHRLVRAGQPDRPRQRTPVAARVHDHSPVRRRPVRRLRATPPRGPLTMRRRLVSWLLVPALAAALLTGCGISDPYAGTHAATSTSTSSSAAALTNADPAPERGGTIPAGARAAQSRLSAGAARPTPQAALERYARLYVNWTADSVAAVQRELASLSERPSASPSATGRRQLHTRPNTHTERRRQQRPPRRHHPEPHDAGAMGPRDLRADDAAKATTQAFPQPCMSSTRKSLGPRQAGS